MFDPGPALPAWPGTGPGGALPAERERSDGV